MPTSEPSPLKPTATHKSTSHLTQTIHLHTSYLCPASTLQWSPSQHIELQLPPDLDLIGGRAALDDERRRLALTPCRYSYIGNTGNTSSQADGADDDEDGGAAPTGVVEVKFVTRTGSLTSQIGLPRFRSLEAAVLGCGGGFPVDVDGSDNSDTVSTAVAGGVGICAFLATSVCTGERAPLCRWQDKGGDEDDVERPMLCWTLHVDDWEFVRHVVERKLLVVDDWNEIHVFLTSGTETMARGRVEQVKEGARKLFGGDERLDIHFRRMQAGDLVRETDSKTTTTTQTTIRFCGRKALEWQIKRWARDMKPPVAVHTTQMQK